MLGCTGYVTNDNGGSGAGDPWHIVMFGNPVSMVAPRLGIDGQLLTSCERGSGIAA
jgi:hypothetical protein